MPRMEKKTYTHLNLILATFLLWLQKKEFGKQDKYFSQSKLAAEAYLKIILPF